MNARCVVEAYKAPRRLGRRLSATGRRMPVISLRHHDNHAWFSWGVSPFAKCDHDPVMVLVIDGAGDDSAISTYVARSGSLRLLYRNDGLWDSLGMMYGIMSSSQGGWPLLSSEGRYMGAAAWGDPNRLTNRYYGPFRDVFVLESEGRVFLNRALANWHRGGCSSPYTKRLVQMMGEPILPKGMWHPDAVLRVEDIEHAPITIDRVDKAAAVQLVFEDALFHIVQHLIRATRSTRLVLTGDAGSTELVHSSSLTSQAIRVGRDGQATTAVVYDSSGSEVRTYDLRGTRPIPVPSGGFAIITG